MMMSMNGSPNQNFHSMSNPSSPGLKGHSSPSRGLDDSLASISNIIGLSPGMVRPLCNADSMMMEDYKFAPLADQGNNPAYWNRMAGTSTPPRSPVPVVRIGNVQRQHSAPSNMMFSANSHFGGQQSHQMMVPQNQHYQQQQQQQEEAARQAQLAAEQAAREPPAPAKPPYSFPCLIGLALGSCETGRMSVSQIYDYICGRFPYFLTAKAGWKNSVRHNLSLNKFFQKLERKESEAGKGSMWGIVPENKEQLKRDIQACKNRFPNGTRPAASAAASRQIPASPAPKQQHKQQAPYQLQRVASAPVMSVPLMKVDESTFGSPAHQAFGNTAGFRGVGSNGRGSQGYSTPGGPSRRLSLPSDIPVGIPEEQLFSDFNSASINDLLGGAADMMLDGSDDLLSDAQTMTTWIAGPSSPNSDSSGSVDDMNAEFETTWQQYLPEDLNAYMGTGLGDAQWAPQV